MRRIIHNLRQQPEETRRHVLHVLTAVCGVLLISLWVYNLGRTASAPKTASNAKSELNPISVLKASLLDGYYSLSGGTENSEQ